MTTIFIQKYEYKRYSVRTLLMKMIALSKILLFLNAILLRVVGEYATILASFYLETSGYRLMVGCDLPKVETRVRFPLPAPEYAKSVPM